MRTLLFVLSALVLVGATAQGGTLDDFSSDSSAKYVSVLRYDPGGVGAPLYGRNASNQFMEVIGTPAEGSYGAGTQNIWFRNDWTLDVGQTIAVDVVGFVANPIKGDTYSIGGLGLSTSQSAATNFKGFTLEYDPTDTVNGFYAFDYYGSTPSLPDLDITHPVNIALTRTSDTAVDFAVNYTKTGVLGHGILTGTYSGLTAGTQYFGLNTYNANETIPVLDNLAHSAVPEPSALVLLAGFLIGLLAYAWRKQR